MTRFCTHRISVAPTEKKPCLLNPSLSYFHSIAFHLFVCGQELLLQPASTPIHTHTHPHTQGQFDCLFNGLGAGSDDFPRECRTASRGGTDCCRTTGRPTWHHHTWNKQLPPRPEPPAGECSQPSTCMAQVCWRQNRACCCICPKSFGFVASCCRTTHRWHPSRCMQSSLDRGAFFDQQRFLQF